MENFERKVSLHDNEGNLFQLEIEIRQGNGKSELSICGNGAGHGGQCSDSIKPRTDAQKEILDIWDKYHLNGTNPGTKDQMKLLKDNNIKGYNKAKEYLQTHTIGGAKLSIVEYNKLIAAIELYQKRKTALSEVSEVILSHAGINTIYFDKKLKDGKLSYAKYSDESIALSYFKEFKELIGGRNTFDFGKEKIIKSDFGSIGKAYNFRREKLKEVLSKIYIEVPQDIYLSAYAVRLNGEVYMYGHGWVENPLPAGFKLKLDRLIDTLVEEDLEYDTIAIDPHDIKEDFFQDKVEDLDIDEDKLMAICLKFKLGREGLENLEKGYGDNDYEIEGENYLVCDNDEADEEHLEDIKNLVDDIGFEGFRGGNQIDTELDEDGDIIVSKSITIPQNERGNNLNSWNGEEETFTFNNTEFYFYRR